MPVRIYLVDDNLTFLTAVSRFLAQLPGADVIGQSRFGLDALAKIEQLKPDVVLLDIGLPDISGVDVGLEMSRWTRPPHIIILSMNDSAGYSALAEKLGALAFVNKADFVQELPLLLDILAALPPAGTCK